MSMSTAEIDLILASASPRRKYLLEQAGLTFSVIPSEFDEEGFAPLATPELTVRRLAEAKAAAVADNHPEAWVLGADTVVVINGNTLGKPADEKAALAMLSQLSGNTHRVMTGYAVLNLSKGHQFSETIVTQVHFKSLTLREIQWYIHTREPFDKAGAYAIQGLGTFLVRRINGSYTNVVGLPVCEVLEHLIEVGAVELAA